MIALHQVSLRSLPFEMAEPDTMPSVSEEEGGARLLRRLKTASLHILRNFLIRVMSSKRNPHRAANGSEGVRVSPKKEFTLPPIITISKQLPTLVRAFHIEKDRESSGHFLSPAIIF
jgi:hypothetical protein